MVVVAGPGPSPAGSTPGSGTDPNKGAMAIFELLEYIVHQPPPILPRGVVSDDFADFVQLWSAFLRLLDRA